MVNEQIRDIDVRLIDSDGKMLGIVSAREAQKIANSKNLDLVMVAPQANPPVCKIMDYGKYMFEQSKREKEARKKQKTINIKEVWMKPQIEDHDFNFKTKHAMRFLKDGDKVKVGVRFRGREMQHVSLGRELLLKFAEAAKEYGDIERQPKLEGRNMVLILVPKKESAKGGL
jgi:translation initiation factor IF-3